MDTAIKTPFKAETTAVIKAETTAVIKTAIQTDIKENRKKKGVRRLDIRARKTRLIRQVLAEWARARLHRRLKTALISARKVGRKSPKIKIWANSVWERRFYIKNSAKELSLNLEKTETTSSVWSRLKASA